METNTSKEDADAALKTAIKANTFKSLQSALEQYETDASVDIVMEAKRAMAAGLRALEPLTLAEAVALARENGAAAEKSGLPNPLEFVKEKVGEHGEFKAADPESRISPGAVDVGELPAGVVAPARTSGASAGGKKRTKRRRRTKRKLTKRRKTRKGKKGKKRRTKRR